MLEIRGLRVAYGGILAVKGVDIEVGAGELVCLIGANGAGKTTTLKAIAGLTPRTEGAVRLEGKDVAGLPSHELVRRGLALVPEGRGIFGRLTVRENLQMGAFHRDDGGVRRDLEHVLALMPRLAERLHQTGGTLSGGEQQMLAIGRALMARPMVLLLDEPSMGLAPVLVELVFKTIQDINAQGMTVLLVEQNAHMALSIAHRGYVLQTGKIVLADSATNLAANEMVRKAYLGVE